MGRRIIYMTLETRIAIQLHEDWRSFKKNSDGTFESVWHKVKTEDRNFLDNLDFSNLPATVRVVNGEVEIDMANLEFANLSTDLQKEYYESAKVIADVLRKKDELTLDQIGEIIYNASLTRQTLKRKAKTFEELSAKKQKQILREYRVGLEVLNETKINEKSQEMTMTL